MTEKEERIAKKMADAGLCSRREAERWILSGRVRVNGQILTTPACVVGANDTILIDGKPLKNKQKIRVWLYHKPCGLVTTYKDPQGRPTVFDSLPKSLGRVISVGRLDLNSEGLLILTNDGALARYMELPKTGLKRTYRVAYAPCDIKVEKHSGTNTWLIMTLKEGKNREIRRMMKFFGLEVSRLIRISYGPYELGDLAKGRVKEVPCVLFPE